MDFLLAQIILLLPFCTILTHGAAPLHLQGIGAKAAVTYATTPNAVRQWLHEHCSASSCVLGFDTETRPTFRKGSRPNPPAVVQLSTMDACLVVQIHNSVADGRSSGGTDEKYHELRNSLAEALSNSSILKAGVEIDEDAIDLWQFWGLELNGRVELGGGNKQRVALAQLLLYATGIQLVKSKNIQMSNWASRLNEKQIGYAAADAWAGSAIYDRLVELDQETFGYEAVSRLLLHEEFSCDHLYAYRRARQATKVALASLFGEIQSRSLPYLSSTLNDSERKAVGSQVLSKLGEASNKVSTLLAPPRSPELPVALLLEKHAWTGPPRGSASQGSS